VTHWLPMLAAVAAALLAAVVLWPLRQQGRRSFVLGVVALGVAGACLYLLVGNPQAAQVQPAPSVATLRDGVEALQQALQRDPQRADGWALLGRSQAELGNAAAAADAFNRAAALAPDEPGVLVEAAQARAQADPGKQFDDTALAWLQAQITIAREAAGQPLDTPAATAPTLLQVRVHLPASLKAGDWPASTQVFVLARAVGGPPMPVAARKLPLASFPATVGLGDGDSPMPTAPLSAHREVEVLARISRSGSANRSEDDLQTAPVKVSLPHDGVVELRFP